MFRASCHHYRAVQCLRLRTPGPKYSTTQQPPSHSHNKPPSSSPLSTQLEPLALEAREESTPLAVRLRREKKLLDKDDDDVVASRPPVGVVTPTDEARYRRLKALQRLPEGITLEDWSQRVNTRRSRIRGLLHTKTGIQVVGIPIYLPNIPMTFIPNKTRLGKVYNPYEATFRVPLSVTKNDIRAYLKSVYGVETTYVRTDIRRPKELTPMMAYATRVSKSRTNPPHRRAHKRAVVGLVEPFYYPNRVEDMSVEEREKWEKEFLDADYFKRENLVGEKAVLMSMSPMNPSSRERLARIGLKNESFLKSQNRGTILANVMRMRKEREERVAALAGKIGRARELKKKTDVVNTGV